MQQGLRGLEGVTVHFELRKGVTLPATAKPQGPATDRSAISAIALLGDDYPSVVFDLRVQEGDVVHAGQTLCVDRQRPEICFVAAASGQVRRITLGARRRLKLLEIAASGDSAITFDVNKDSNDAPALRALLLKSGAWTGFRTRPFGLIPPPDASPAAIFVTATEAHPQAPDPRRVLAPHLADFQRGTEALMQLTRGPVVVCQRQGAPLLAQDGRLKIATFAGPYPSGDAGPQIHRIMPVSRQRVVWEIGYQEVLAIGHLLASGRVMTTRTITLCGPNDAAPLMMTAPLGAKLSEVAQATEGSALLSGSLLRGHKTAYLRRRDLQITTLNGDPIALPARPFWRRLMETLPTAPIGATLPLEAYERAFPFDILPAPLLRALAVCDVDTAERLGCLELLEEDLALLSRMCPSGQDYGQLLRHMFQLMSKERIA